MSVLYANPQQTHQPLPSFRVSPLINGSSAKTAKSNLMSSCSSCLHCSTLSTFTFASRPVKFKLPETHISGLQCLLSLCVESKTSPSYTLCFSFSSWQSEVFHPNVAEAGVVAQWKLIPCEGSSVRPAHGGKEQLLTRTIPPSGK